MFVRLRRLCVILCFSSSPCKFQLINTNWWQIVNPLKDGIRIALYASQQWSELGLERPRDSLEYHSLCLALLNTQSLLCGSRSQQTQKDFSPTKETFIICLYCFFCIDSEVAFYTNMRNDSFCRLFRLYEYSLIQNINDLVESFHVLCEGPDLHNVIMDV